MKVLVGNVGTRYLRGVKESIATAVELARAAGHEINVVEQPSICVLPYFGLATMRNRLLMRARQGGYAMVILLDNDVLFHYPGALGLLIDSRGEITVPLLSCADKSQKLQEPAPDSRQSSIPLDWAVFSCIAFNVPALELLGSTPFIDTFCYCEEETTCQRWRLQGAVLEQRTDALVTLLRPPGHLWEQDLSKVQMPGDVRREQIR